MVNLGMITEEKLIAKSKQAKAELSDLLDAVKNDINKGDYDGAIENIAILNANVLACIVCDEFLNAN